MRNSVILLYFFNFLKSLQFFGALAVPFYLHRAGLGYTEMFVLEAVFSFAMLAFEIPTGVVADRFGRRPSLFAGALFFGLGFLFFGIFTSYAVLLAAEVVCAFGMTLMSGADRALLYELLAAKGEEKRASAAAARFDAFGTAGLFIAFPAGSAFAGSGLVEYRTALGLVFTATAASAALAAVMVLFVHESGFKKNEANPFRQGREGLLFVFKRDKLRAFGLNYALISAVTFFMFWFYQSLLMANGFPLSLQGAVASGFNGTALLLLLAVPFFERSIGVGRTLFISSLLPGLLYVAAAVLPGIAPALAAIFGVTNLKMLRAPMLGALMNEQIEDANRATVLSGISMLERLATALLYPAVGLLADRSLNAALAAVGLLTIVLSLLLRLDEEALLH